jgi:DNA-binding transcriptional LysR family regulator
MSQLRRLLPSLNTLVAFEAAVRCGTFAQAAKELGVTGPAVSRTIGRLEGHLGLPLFRRTHSGVVPTKDGEGLYSSIASGFREIERTLIGLTGRNRSSPRPIVLSVSSAFATYWFMPRLAKFQAQFPGEEIDFQLINGPLMGPLDGVDVAMRFDPVADERSYVRPLMPELLLPVCASHYAGSRDFGPLAPTAARMLTLSGSQFHWADLFAPDGNGGTASEVSLTDYLLVVQAALIGQGIAVGWLNVISHLLADGTLTPALPQVVSTGRRCDLVIQRQPQSSIAQDICDWMIGEYRADLAALTNLQPDLGARVSAEFLQG